MINIDISSIWGLRRSSFYQRIDVDFLGEYLFSRTCPPLPALRKMFAWTGIKTLKVWCSTNWATQALQHPSSVSSQSDQASSIQSGSLPSANIVLRTETSCHARVCIHPGFWDTAGQTQSQASEVGDAEGSNSLWVNCWHLQYTATNFGREEELSISARQAAPRMEPWFSLDGMGRIPPVDRVQVVVLLCANHGKFSDPCLRLIIKQMRTLIKQPFLSLQEKNDPSCQIPVLLEFLCTEMRTWGMFVSLWFMSSGCETGRPIRSDKKAARYKNRCMHTIIIFFFPDDSSCW